MLIILSHKESGILPGHFIRSKLKKQKVTVNKKEIGLVFLPPYQIEVTKFLKDGENLLEIEITNSLRNLLGPHHHQKAELLSVVPESFSDEENWTDSYSFIPFGLGKVKLIMEEERRK